MMVPAMLKKADHRDGRGAERRGRGDAEPREHPAGIDRPAHLGHEGREMRGDEAELVAAGEEAHEDQRVGRVAEGAGQDVAHALLELRAPRLGRRSEKRQEQEDRQDGEPEYQEDRLEMELAEEPFHHRRPDDLPRRSGGGGDGERH
jgi:hypothetical protein